MRSADCVFHPEGGVFVDSEGREHEFDSSTGPYEYVLAGLAGCFSYTLYDILDEHDIDAGPFKAHVEGEKRTTVPTTLERTRMSISASGVSEEDRDVFLKCVEDAKEQCSMYRTIALVSAMEVEVDFA